MSVSSLRKTSAPPVLKVFAHLAENKDAERWRARWLAGTLVGVNDESPYGYARANEQGCRVSFSKAGREALPSKIARYGLRFILGFDLLHAWRQRKELAEADVIWTHTESQYLAVAAVAKLTGIKTPIIGQTVWLFDHWFHLSWPKRALYRSLINRVDVLTFLSPLNLEIAQRQFPKADARFVPFGIATEKQIAPRLSRGQQPFRILAIGNDRHRDWETLVKTVANRKDISLVILSGTVPKDLVRDVANVEVRHAKTNDELADELAKATVVCVPLKPNFHASGITVIEEAVLAGVPVVTTDTGGLRSYFAEDEVRYVRPSDTASLLEALLDIARDPSNATEMAKRAQGKMGEGGLGITSYIRDHVTISGDLETRQDVRHHLQAHAVATVAGHSAAGDRGAIQAVEGA